MTKANEPITSIPDLNNHPSSWYGLTKREYFAAMALQGLCANPVHSQKWTFTFWQRVKNFLGLKNSVRSTLGSRISILAVQEADKLINALNKQL